MKCEDGKHSFVTEEGKGLLDKGKQICLNCDVEK